MRIKNYLAFLTLFVVITPAFAQDDSLSDYDAARQAQAAHDLASSDIIYQHKDVTALYYQNIQIIQLLREIRDLTKTQTTYLARIEANQVSRETEKNGPSLRA